MKFILLVLGIIIVELGLCQSLCTITDYPNSILNPYPSHNIFAYAINFNQTIMQANYIWYISPFKGSGCDDCRYFLDDPYGINVLTHDDYKDVPCYNGSNLVNFSTANCYDRGHVVPNADHGNDTYIISNVVPMVPSFNQGVWARHEQFLRETFPGKLFVKGCEYSLDQYVPTQFGNKMYVPLGCYFVIFDIEILPGVKDKIRGEILDYGYFLNEPDSKSEPILPKWINC
jgi:hypothetical protein